MLQHHEHHAECKPRLAEVLEGKSRGVMSAHGFAEAFSVLTRAPWVPPIQPHEAWSMLDRMIVPYFELVHLDGAEHKSLIWRCGVRKVAGGRVYDAVHLACAEKAGAELILTKNLRDFRALAWSDELRDKIETP